ncbi:MAG: hypothetical protein ACLSW5_03180 [Anaerostipes sp.]|uniref:hypothetical protein n=1 Tax=Anaerostipes sp. TaxID=1872530 RepID=UPI0039960754
MWLPPLNGGGSANGSGSIAIEKPSGMPGITVENYEADALLTEEDAQDSSPSTPEHNTEISSTEKNKTTSKQKQTSIGRRNTSSRHTSSKKGTKASTHNSTVSYKDTASTGDQKYDISSLLIPLSGSLICAGMLLTRHLRR